VRKRRERAITHEGIEALVSILPEPNRSAKTYPSRRRWIGIGAMLSSAPF
jgi:hypothetical protein